MKMECPNCGGNIIYVLGSDKVYCEHCNQKVEVSKINISEFTKYVEEMKAKKEQTKNGKRNYINRLLEENGSDSVPLIDQVIYKCTNCNSEFVHNNMIRGKTCPYCFHVTKNTVGGLKEYNVSKIIPFTISKNNISNIICNSIESSEFTPDHVYAMYVPFMAYYDEIQASGIAKSKGNTTYSIKEKIITLKYIGKSLDEELVNTIIDYDFSRYQVFNSALFNRDIILDNIDTDNKDESNKDKIIDSINHDLYVKEKLKSTSTIKDMDVKNIKKEIWLLPIYIYKEKINGSIKTLLVNGQNGRITGRAINHSDKMANAKKIFLIVWLLAIAVAIKMYIDSSSLYVLLITINLFTMIPALIRLLKYSQIRDLNIKGYKFFGITWDKDIKIS